jgi:elongation factor G
MTSPGDTPLLLTLTPSTPADAERLRDGLRQLTAVGGLLRVMRDHPAREITIACVHEGQLELIVDRLKRDFAVSASVSRPTVLYKETLTMPAEGEVKYARQVSGKGVYAHVRLRVRPGARGAGRTIRSSIGKDTIPASFIGSATAGIEQVLEHGVLADHPIDDIVVELYEGSYHEQDSTAAAFEIAGAMAFLEAARKARPVTLEPIMRVDVEGLAAHEELVTRSIASRRGHVVSRQDLGHQCSIVSRVPLAELFGFEHELRTRAGVPWRVVIAFADYQVLESEDDEQGGSRGPHVRSPRPPQPSRRINSIALPEPDDPYWSS